MSNIINFFKGLSATQWIIIAIVVILLIALIIYLSTDKEDDKKDISANNNLATNMGVAMPRNNFPLQYGSKGDEVKALQMYLNTKGEKLVTDGVWGPLTNAAVLRVLNKSVISQELFLNLK